VPSGPTQTKNTMKRSTKFQATMKGLHATLLAPYAVFIIVSIACISTTSDIEGPFYLNGAPFTTQIAKAGEPGERLFISGTVYSDEDTGNCITPIEDTELDVWQANDAGAYDNSAALDSCISCNLRGKMKTDANGQYSFETILPGPYDIGGGQFRPGHIHIKASAQGHTDLTTQLYFEGDIFIPTDPWASDPDAVNRIIPLTQDAGGAWHGDFDIILEGTVVIGIENPAKYNEQGYLLQNHPNPFNRSTLISFEVFNKETKVLLNIYDLKGSLVKKLIHQKMIPGRYTINWNGTNQQGLKVANSIYICKFSMNGSPIKDIKVIVQR